MVRALENPAVDPTYLEFFGFTRSPFAQLSQPSQVFHTEQYSLLMAHLANATDHSDCLVVVCGADGSGKTTLLNRYISSLSDDICLAAINETCSGEKQFYSAFLRQLGFGDVTGKPGELRRITKEFVIHRGMAGDAVIVLIDNAHLINPTVLEQVRRMSAIKVNDQRVLSVVLAGNSDLVRVMDSPAMSQIEFRSRVNFHIRVYSEEETANYIWHHLRLAGGRDSVNISNEAHPLIYRYTGGIPNLINMLCNDLLEEAHAAETRVITEGLVRTVADNRRLVPHVVPLQGKSRRRDDPEFKLVQPERAAEIPIPKVEKSDVENQKLLDQISQLSQQVGQLRADRMRALQDIGTRDKDISELRNILDEAIAESEKLHSTLADNTNEIGRLNLALSDSTKALQKSEKSANKFATELEKERSSANSAHTEIARAQTAAAELEQLNAELQAQVSGLAVELEEERSTAKSAQTESSAAQTTAEELKQLNSELQAAITELTDELKEERKAAKTAQTESSAAQTAAEELEQLNAELQAQITELAAELEKERNTAKSAQTDSSAVQTAAEELEQQNTELQAQISEITKELEDERSIAKSARTENSAVQTAAEELEQQNTELQAQITEITKELEDERSIAKSAQTESSATKAATAELTQLNAELHATVTGLTADLKAAKERIVEIDHIEKNSVELKDEIENMAGDLLTLRGELDSRDEAIGDLDKLLHESQKECASLRPLAASVDNLEESVSEKDARIADLQAELATYSEEIMALEERNEELESADVELTEAEDIAALELELQEVRQMLADAQAQLINSPKLLVKAETDTQDSKAREKDPPAPGPEVTPDSADEQFGSGITALEIVREGKIEQVMGVPDGQARIMIGRSEDSELCLQSEFVSRHHALLFCKNGAIDIEDLNSFNGTIINSKKITRAELRPDDIVLIGEYQIRPRQT